MKNTKDAVTAFAATVHDGPKTDRLFHEAVQDALREHKRLGQSVVVWQDGQIVTLAPEDIPVDDPARQP